MFASYYMPWRYDNRFDGEQIARLSEKNIKKHINTITKCYIHIRHIGWF